MPPRAEPDQFVTSADGTPIALFRSGRPDGLPLVLVHGAAADHTTWRVVGPRLAERYDVVAIDRRGRGASGDREPYAIEREFEDVAAVADAVAGQSDGPDRSVVLVGHSLGGRVALGAALVSSRVAGVVAYEGAPPAPDRPYQVPGLLARLDALHQAGHDEELLRTFLAEVVGMRPADLATYQADPVWPARVAAAGTIARELAGEASAAAGLDVLSRVDVPVLQLLGGDSVPAFGAAVRALDARLGHGQVEVIGGARHAAHHTHPDAFLERLTAFVERL